MARSSGRSGSRARTSRTWCAAPGLTALRRGLDANEVTKEDFEAALGETRASVTPEMLEEYERIQKTLKSDAVRPTGIGFVLPGMLSSRGGDGKGAER